MAVLPGGSAAAARHVDPSAAAAAGAAAPEQHADPAQHKGSSAAAAAASRAASYAAPPVTDRGEADGETGDGWSDVSGAPPGPAQPHSYREAGHSWKPTSAAQLRAAEAEMLRRTAAAAPGRVRQRELCGLNTLRISPPPRAGAGGAPVVLLHGFGNGVAMWCQQFLPLAGAGGEVWAVDLQGFGRSARPSFSGSTPEEALEYLLHPLERWMAAAGFDEARRCVLIGHSMGGYVAAHYAARHPARVQCLVLTDPWGVNPRPPDAEERFAARVPWYFRAGMAVVRHCNPLAGLRLAGPWGPDVMSKARGHLGERFAASGSVADPSAVASYLWHCNAQEPEGEAAFHTLQELRGGTFAKQPAAPLLRALPRGLPVHFIFGNVTWMAEGARESEQVCAERTEDGGVGSFAWIPGAGHNVQMDQPQHYNRRVLHILQAQEGWRKWNAQ